MNPDDDEPVTFTVGDSSYGSYAGMKIHYRAAVNAVKWNPNDPKDLRRYAQFNPALQVEGFEMKFEAPQGFTVVTVEQNDDAIYGKRCRQCHGAFLPDQVIVESWDQTVQIHSDCVIELYRMLPATVADAFDERRNELLNRGFGIDD